MPSSADTEQEDWWGLSAGPWEPWKAPPLSREHLALLPAGVKFQVLEHEAGRPLRLLMQVRPLCTPNTAACGQIPPPTPTHDAAHVPGQLGLGPSATLGLEHHRLRVRYRQEGPTELKS